MDDAAADGDGHRLGSISRRELLQDVPQMGFHRFLGDGQLRADFAIPIARGDSPQHLDLALAECIPGNVLRQLLRNHGRQVLATPMNLANDLDKLLQRSALQQVTARTGRQFLFQSAEL